MTAKVYENGQYINKEIGEIQPPLYAERVVSRIRERYSVDDELAILRQRDTKPDEFYAYFQYVEQVKAEERGNAQ